MKTITRLFFIMLLVTGTSAYAQPTGPTALTDLQNELQNLQSTEATLQSQIAAAQADLLSQQDLVASLDVQIADESAARNDVAPLQADRTEALGMITMLQENIAVWQSELASVQNEIAAMQSQIQSLLQDRGWVSANMSSSTPVTFERITKVPIANDPSSQFAVFLTTGDLQQDAAVVQQWLQQHGILDPTR